MDPRLEPVGLTQVWEPPPGEDEGVLQRVLGETRVAQDPERDGVERVADLVHQDGERLAIPMPSLLDEASVHLNLPPRGLDDRVAHYDGGSQVKRSGHSARNGLAPACQRGPIVHSIGRAGRQVARLIGDGLSMRLRREPVG